MYYCVLRKWYQLDSHDNDNDIISSPMPLKTASNRVDQSHNEIGFPSAHVPDKNIVKSIHQVERNNDRDCVEYSRQNNSIDSQEWSQIKVNLSHMENLWSTIKQRRRFDFSLCDFMYSILWPVKFDYPCLRKDGKSVHSNYVKFQKGMEKYNVDLDITNILTTVKRMKTLSDLILSSDQKLLEKYSKHHLIDVPNDVDLDYMQDVPAAKCRQLLAERKAHSENLNDFIYSFSDKQATEWDRFMISNISEDILVKESEDF